jgi:hypothetical protein
MAKSTWTLESLKEMHDHDLAAKEKLFLAEIHRLDEGVKAAQVALELLADERRRAQDKFEDTVTARFVQINEFRGALDDLGKDMATRRELEASMEAVRTERASLVTANDARLSEHSKQIIDLRSRLDVGPIELRTLQDRSNQSIGAERKERNVGLDIRSNIGLIIALLTLAYLVASGHLH